MRPPVNLKVGHPGYGCSYKKKSMTIQEAFNNVYAAARLAQGTAQDHEMIAASAKMLREFIEEKSAKPEDDGKDDK